MSNKTFLVFAMVLCSFSCAKVVKIPLVNPIIGAPSVIPKPAMRPRGQYVDGIVAELAWFQLQTPTRILYSDLLRLAGTLSKKPLSDLTEDEREVALNAAFESAVQTILRISVARSEGIKPNDTLWDTYLDAWKKASGLSENEIEKELQKQQSSLAQQKEKYLTQIALSQLLIKKMGQARLEALVKPHPVTYFLFSPLRSSQMTIETPAQPIDLVETMRKEAQSYRARYLAKPNEEPPITEFEKVELGCKYYTDLPHWQSGDIAFEKAWTDSAAPRLSGVFSTELTNGVIVGSGFLRVSPENCTPPGMPNEPSADALAQAKEEYQKAKAAFLAAWQQRVLTAIWDQQFPGWVRELIVRSQLNIRFPNERFRKMSERWVKELGIHVAAQ